MKFEMIKKLFSSNNKKICGRGCCDISFKTDEEGDMRESLDEE